MRAISVQIDEFSGVAGHLTPGCRVDVLATITDPKTQKQISRTVAHSLLVRAVGGQFRKSADQKDPVPVRSVTLLVTPREAELVQLATTAAKSWLVLRSGRDGQTATESAGATMEDLMGGPDAKLPEPVVATASVEKTPAKVPGHSITVIRGGKQTQVELSVPGSGSFAETESGAIVPGENQGR
jgi:pilus assembly protein CpaB